MDILVCPFDKVTTLDLFEFKTTTKAVLESENTQNPTAASNKSLSSIHDDTLRNSNNTKTTLTKPSQSTDDIPSSIIEEGILLCKSCLRYYPITEEIPIILPDELRDKKKDLEFLKKWKENIPNDLLGNLKPWTL